MKKVEFGDEKIPVSPMGRRAEARRCRKRFRGSHGDRFLFFALKERYFPVMYIPSLDDSAVQTVTAHRRSVQNRACRALKRLSAATERFWLSRWYFPAMLLAAAACSFADQEVIGVAVLACLSAWFLALCPDFLACVCPFVMIFLLSGSEYTDISVFYPCVILVLPLAMSLVLHLILWPVTFRVGRSGRGLALVCLATLLGGCNVIRPEEYWSPLSLYYTLGLGVMLLAIYLLFRSYLRQERSYDLGSRFAALFTTLGLLMTAILLAEYAGRWQEFLNGGELLFIWYRNFAATVLLTMLPASLYLALRHRLHLLSAAVMLMGMVLTGSRSALLFGTVELMLGCIYLVRYGAVSRRVMLAGAAVCAVGMALFGLPLLKTLYAGRMVGGELIRADEVRWKILARGIDDFLHHPMFGMGLGNRVNSDLFRGVKGSMFFYHNLLVQIMGSMGLLGLVAYARLIKDRISLLLRRRTPFTVAFAMCYLGMVMVSMTNPGEFCPLPNAGLMVMLFAVVEETVGDAAIPVTQALGLHRYNHRAKVMTFSQK